MKKSFFDEKQLPLVLEPENGDKSLSTVVKWVNENRQEFDQAFYTNGAVLFRGFDINTPADFEKLALSIDPGLRNDYLGTSPRDRVAGTEYIFSASELPPFYPIMQHCEMSYVDNPPIRLFFYCHIEPPYGGETPVCNFREVYRQLPEHIRRDFDEKGVLTVRNYSGLEKKKGPNLWELKRWDEIFHTTDKKEVERQCEEYHIEYEWMEGGKLRLIHRTPATIKHPVTGETTWFNHTQVFHPEAGPVEYKYIHDRQKRIPTLAWWVFIRTMVNLKKRSVAPIDQSMNVLFGDGTPIPDDYVKTIEEVIWKNMVIFPWKKNDVIAIDNFSTSHGRLPFKGPREILVCWTA